MRKLALAMTATAALAFGTAATAAPIITGPTPITNGGSPLDQTTGFTTGVNGSCVNGPTPCTFTNTLSFVTPDGFNRLNVSLNTVASSTDGVVDQTTNLNFNPTFTLMNSLGTFTGTTFTNDGGISEFGSLLNSRVVAGGTNTLTVGGTTGTSTNVNANFSGVLSFSNAPTVPEPATWAMMLVGFGAAGYSLRRKKSSAIRMQAA